MGNFPLDGEQLFEHWQVFLSPLAGKSTTVLDEFRDKAAFGVDTGATWRFEAGAKITLNYTQTVQRCIFGDCEVGYLLQLLGPIARRPILCLDIIALYKIKEAFSVNAHVQLIRDIDQIDAWQRRSVLGVALAYTIK